MDALFTKTLSTLKKMYDDERKIFSFSTKIINNNFYNDITNPLAIRYSIICIAGLYKLSKLQKLDWDVNNLIMDFIKHNWDSIRNWGDKGLFLSVLSYFDKSKADQLFSDIHHSFQTEKDFTKLNLQEISWLLMGLVEYSKVQNQSKVLSYTEIVYKVIKKYYINVNAILPFNEPYSLRKSFVSFGAITYYLKSLYEYGKAFNDDDAINNFKKITLRIIKMQSDSGEWAWFYNSKTSNILDWYQIYSVHQDSMSILFLLPARDLGLVEADQAIIKSYRWLFGYNNKGFKMINENPFFIYRSVKKKGKFERVKRLICSYYLSLLNTNANLENKHNLVINKECRSYELGWVLYSWAGCKDYREFTNLELL